MDPWMDEPAVWSQCRCGAATHHAYGTERGTEGLIDEPVDRVQPSSTDLHVGRLPSCKIWISFSPGAVPPFNKSTFYPHAAATSSDHLKRGWNRRGFVFQYLALSLFQPRSAEGKQLSEPGSRESERKHAAVREPGFMHSLNSCAHHKSRGGRSAGRRSSPAGRWPTPDRQALLEKRKRRSFQGGSTLWWLNQSRAPPRPSHPRSSEKTPSAIDFVPFNQFKNRDAADLTS